MALFISVVAREKAQVKRVIDGRGARWMHFFHQQKARPQDKIPMNKTYVLRRRTRTRGVVRPWMSVDTSQNRHFLVMKPSLCTKQTIRSCEHWRTTRPATILRVSSIHAVATSPVLKLCNLTSHMVLYVTTRHVTSSATWNSTAAVEK